MNTKPADELWAVVCDDGVLETIQLKTLASVCRKAFTSPQPQQLCMPVLSIWNTKQEAELDLESLRGFEKVLNR